MGISDDLKSLQESINSGEVSRLPSTRLEQFTASLCHSQAYAFFGERQFAQVCETVRLNLLRAYLQSLQLHITGLNAQNAQTQKWVIALAIVAVISSVVQIFSPMLFLKG